MTRRKSPQWNWLKRWMLRGTSTLQENEEEADVRTYKKIRRPEFRPRRAGTETKEGMWKDKVRNTHFEPHWRRDGHSCCPVSSSYRRYLECPQTGGLQGRLRPKNEEVLRRRIGKCLSDMGCNVVQSMISTAKTNLKMAADTLLLALQYLDHGHTTCITFMPGN